MHTVCIDFDGVIHSYIQSWVSEDIIPDLPVKGIKEAIDQLRMSGFKIVIFSSRALSEKGKTAVINYLNRYDIKYDGITSEKIPAMVYIDDRAICFDGNALALVDKVKNFKPWNR